MNADGRLNWKAYAALLAIYIIWSTTVAGIKLGVDSIPVTVLPCARFFMAGLLLVVFCLVRGERLPDWRTLRTHAIIGALLFVGGNAWVSWTVKHMTTGMSGLMVATTPFWMVWLSSRMPPREKIPPVALMGIGIGFVGMMVLLFPQMSHMGNTSPWFWVALITLLCITFSWALGSIYARKNPTDTSLLMSVGLQNLSAGIILIPFMIGSVSDWHALHPTSTSLAALGYLILFGSIVATPCYMYVLKTLPVSLSSTFAYVTPVLTVVFGAVFLGEPISPSIVAGAALIIAAVFVVQMNQQPVRTKVLSPESTTPLQEGIGHVPRTVSR